MTDYRVGQRVHVEFDGEVHSIDSYIDGWFEVRDSKAHYIHRLWRDSVANIVTPLEPADWPPRPGDIWETADREYYVTHHGGRLFLHPIDAYGSTYSFLTDDVSNLDSFKEKNPKLIRRREGN